MQNRIIVYAGQYYDSETGLHYNYHRYYDPKLGRYLRADPIGLEGGINPYLYTNSNPVNSIDPLGLFDISAEYMQGLAAYANFRISALRLQATLDAGSQHYTTNGPNYVSQGASITGDVGPLSAGLGVERTAPGESHGYSYDRYGRVIPGTGLSVNDILRGTPFEVQPLISWGSVEWAKITIGAQVLIGAEVTLDLREEAAWLIDFLSDLFSDGKDEI